MKTLLLILALTLVPASAYAVCGDGVRDSGEQCDDGNTLADDGCNPICFLECGTFTRRSTNGTLEFPGEEPGTWGLFHEDAVPGWFSTRADKMIEFWGTGFLGIVAPSGGSFIELMSTGPGGVYQYIDTVPGTRIEWSVKHRARQRWPAERIRVLIGVEDKLVSQGVYRGGVGYWTTRSGVYEVPAGQYRTRIQIESASPSSGSVGNLIDDFQIKYPDVVDVYQVSGCPTDDMSMAAQVDGPGRIQIAGNSALTCDDQQGGCVAARDFSGSVLNSQYRMVHVDAESDAGTFNSSSSDISLNSGESVVWAGLYWMGIHSVFGKPASIATPPVDADSRGQVKFRAPGSSSYVTVTGTVDEIDNAFYRGFADVTSLVDQSGTAWVADLQTTTGRHMFAGWTLVVITSDPTLPVRSMTVFDPFERIIEERTFVIDNFASSHAFDANMEIGAVMHDGDPKSTDYILVNGNLIQPLDADPMIPFFQWDLGNSTVSRQGQNVTTRSPAYRNNFGFDADVWTANGLSGGDTTIALEIFSPRDVLLTNVFTIQTDILTPSSVVQRDARGVELQAASENGQLQIDTEPQSSAEVAALAEFSERLRPPAHPHSFEGCTTTDSSPRSTWLWVMMFVLLRRAPNRRSASSG